MLLLGAALPGEAWAGGGRPRVRVYPGPGPIWWAPGFIPRPFIVYPHHARPYYGPRGYYPPASGYGPLVYGYAPPGYAPPAVVQQAPFPGQQHAFAPPPPQYWYFCQDAGAYYPYVKECQEGWMKVVPPLESGGGAGGPPEADQD